MPLTNKLDGMQKPIKHLHIYIDELRAPYWLYTHRLQHSSLLRTEFMYNVEVEKFTSENGNVNRTKSPPENNIKRIIQKDAGAHLGAIKL